VPVTSSVSISGGFSSPGTQCTVISPFPAHSRTKRWRRRICFVRLLYDSVDAPWLSIHTLGTALILGKARTSPSHMASWAPIPSAMYSASVDDSVVTSCFLVVHESELVPEVTSTLVVCLFVQVFLCEHIYLSFVVMGRDLPRPVRPRQSSKTVIVQPDWYQCRYAAQPSPETCSSRVLAYRYRARLVSARVRTVPVGFRLAFLH